MGSILDNIKFINQPTIKVKGGNVMKVMKISDYKEFSFHEAYFSSIDLNYIKGWKMQLKMSSNICVPVGEVKFTFVSKDFRYHKTYTLGENNYGTLSVPPGIWYCFKGLSEKTSLILNISDSEHNEEHIKKINLEEFPLKLKL